MVCEAPTYPGAVPTFCAYEADVVQVTMDRDGMRIEELSETLDRLEREGRRPKFIYTVPNFHNPAGVTLSLERRLELVRIASERTNSASRLVGPTTSARKSRLLSTESWWSARSTRWAYRSRTFSIAQARRMRQDAEIISSTRSISTARRAGGDRRNG